MRIEELRIGQVVYNTYNEKLTVEGISTEMNCEKVLTRNSKRLGKFYHPTELSDTPTETEWVDLGLPSGTLWKNDIERDKDGKPLYLSWAETEEKYNRLPKSWQFVELCEECSWIWNSEKKGYRIIGSNGNEIFLPCCGYHDYEHASGSIRSEYGGYYWSTLMYSTYCSYALVFHADDVYPMHAHPRSNGFTIILCKTNENKYGT